MRRLAVLAVAALFVACEAAPDPTGLDELSFAPAFAITTVSGIDAGAASGDARPNADAAAASFDAEIAALGNFFIENLEGAPLGSFTSLAVLAATINTNGWFSTAISNVDQGRILGYNTTSGGSQHLNLVPVFAAGTETVEFNYIAPVQAWGAYFTGVGTVPATSVHVRFDDGSAQSFQVPGDPSGGVSFFGFSNPGKIITQVKVEEDLTGDPQTTRDIFSIDDIRISFAKGGFVTGGGWIDSPAGAYKPELSLAGRASFGFVSKYKKGAQTPSGQTEFQFQTGDLNFHSSSYDWLLVTGEGDKAQFKGTGTINGEGTFKFMVWAGDDDPDTFRIRIWVEDPLGVETAVYDNAVGQPIAGGSIVIHKK